MADREPIKPEDCPEPFWHETHRYCPVCTWTEPLPPKQCDIRGCAGVATTKWWAGDRSFYVELCDKHSHVYPDSERAG